MPYCTAVTGSISSWTVRPSERAGARRGLPQQSVMRHQRCHWAVPRNTRLTGPGAESADHRGRPAAGPRLQPINVIAGLQDRYQVVAINPGGGMVPLTYTVTSSGTIGYVNAAATAVAGKPRCRPCRSIRRCCYAKCGGIQLADHPAPTGSTAALTDATTRALVHRQGRHLRSPRPIQLYLEVHRALCGVIDPVSRWIAANGDGRPWRTKTRAVTRGGAAPPASIPGVTGHAEAFTQALPPTVISAELLRLSYRGLREWRHRQCPITSLLQPPIPHRATLPRLDMLTDSRHGTVVEHSENCHGPQDYANHTRPTGCPAREPGRGLRLLPR
jgi:hypothetical protein